VQWRAHSLAPPGLRAYKSHHPPSSPLFGRRPELKSTSVLLPSSWSWRVSFPLFSLEIFLRLPVLDLTHRHPRRSRPPPTAGVRPRRLHHCRQVHLRRRPLWMSPTPPPLQNGTTVPPPRSPHPRSATSPPSEPTRQGHHIRAGWKSLDVI
jgi:hypothetical protein